MDNIILIGFMGCGKTSLGLKLAKALNYSFHDTDRLIEEQSRKSIREIFQTSGEEYFRQLETDLIKSLYGGVLTNSVLSVGGGLPIKPGNAALLRGLGQVVYLKTSKDTLLKRLKGDTTRPLLKGDNVEKKIDSLLVEREPIYEACSHRIVITDNRTYEEILHEIIEKSLC